MIISICLLSIPAFGYTYNASIGQDVAGDGIGFTALDGTWSHNNGSDNWDGTGIVGAAYGTYTTAMSNTDMPGGIECMYDTLVEPGTEFMRFQTPGATDKYKPGGITKYQSNLTGSSSANMFLAHELAGFTDNWLDDGSAHIEFRARLATNDVGGDLDQVDIKRGYTDATTYENAWPNFGAGANCRSTGKNMIDVHQVVSDDGSPTTLAGKIIGFGLDVAGGDERNGWGILNMNALNGNLTSEDVDFGEGLSAALDPFNPNPLAKENYMLIPDVDTWHDYAIDIIADFDGIGTHDVTVTVDGVYTQTFTVTAGADEYLPNQSDDVEYKDINYVSMGDGQSRSSMAFDLDYLTVTPEPMTLTLLGLGGLGLLRRRRA